MELQVNHISANSWQEVYKKVKKAVVFLDNFCAESLHWHGGLMELLKSGALAIKDFSSFESGSEKDRKAVFITAGPVVGAPREILKDLIANSSFEYCVLIMACSPSVQKVAQEEMSWDTGGDMTVFHRLEQDMLHWMGNKEYTVEILNFPLFLTPITSTLFVTPPFTNLFPYFKENLFETTVHDTKKPIKIENLPKEQRISIHHLTSSLHTLLTQLDMSEEIYSLGYLSGIVASQLEAYSPAVTRRKTASKRTCLILIDRTLDLGSVTSFSSNSLLDRLRTVLPRLPQHSNDVAVEMSSLCAGTEGSVAPGCLAHKGPVLDWLVNMKQKDVLLNLYQELEDTLETSGKRLLRITPQVLDKQIVSSFTQKYKLIMKNCGLIEQILGVTEALKSDKNSAIELAMSIEKLVLQTMAADNGTSGAINQIVQLIRCRHERGLNIKIILSILFHLYSIVGSQFTFTADDEALLQGEISKALYIDKHLLKNSWLGSKGDLEVTVEDVDIFSNQIMHKLHSVSATRNHFVKYRNVLKNEGPLQPLVYNSLIEQLIADLVDVHKPTLPDLVHKPDGLFKSGFSKLLSSTRHPSDSHNFIFYMIGGITGQESHQITDAFQKAGKAVLVGSTTLVCPSDILDLLFNQESLCNIVC